MLYLEIGYCYLVWCENLYSAEAGGVAVVVSDDDAGVEALEIQDNHRVCVQPEETICFR